MCCLLRFRWMLIAWRCLYTSATLAELRSLKVLLLDTYQCTADAVLPSTLPLHVINLCTCTFAKHAKAVLHQHGTEHGT